MRKFWRIFLTLCPLRNNPFILAVITALFNSVNATATDVTLTWNPSPDTNITNYRIWAWTNTPDAQCSVSNAAQVTLVGNVTNVVLVDVVPLRYTFAATSVNTNVVPAEESLFSNFSHLPQPPDRLIILRTSGDLIGWTNTQQFYRLEFLK